MRYHNIGDNISWGFDIVEIGDSTQKFNVGDEVEFYQERHLNGIITSIIHGYGTISEKINGLVYKIDGDETGSYWNPKFIKLLMKRGD